MANIPISTQQTLLSNPLQRDANVGNIGQAGARLQGNPIQSPLSVVQGSLQSLGNAVGNIADVAFQLNREREEGYKNEIKRMALETQLQIKADQAGDLYNSPEKWSANTDEKLKALNDRIAEFKTDKKLSNEFNQWQNDFLKDSQLRQKGEDLLGNINRTRTLSVKREDDLIDLHVSTGNWDDAEEIVKQSTLTGELDKNIKLRALGEKKLNYLIDSSVEDALLTEDPVMSLNDIKNQDISVTYKQLENGVETEQKTSMNELERKKFNRKIESTSISLENNNYKILKSAYDNYKLYGDNKALEDTLNSMPVRFRSIFDGMVAQDEIKEAKFINTEVENLKSDYRAGKKTYNDIIIELNNMENVGKINNAQYSSAIKQLDGITKQESALELGNPQFEEIKKKIQDAINTEDFSIDRIIEFQNEINSYPKGALSKAQIQKANSMMVDGMLYMTSRGKGINIPDDVTKDEQEAQVVYMESLRLETQGDVGRFIALTKAYEQNLYGSWRQQRKNPMEQTRLYMSNLGLFTNPETKEEIKQLYDQAVGRLKDYSPPEENNSMGLYMNTFPIPRNMNFYKR